MLTEWEKWKQSLGDSRPWHLIDPNLKIKDKSKIDARLNICKTCPSFINMTTQCKECGCIMKAKAMLVNAECPLKKWGKEI